MKFNYFFNPKLEEANPEKGYQGEIIIPGVNPIKTDIEDITPKLNDTDPINDIPPKPDDNDTPPATGTSGDKVTIDDGTGPKEYILDDNGNATLEGQIIFTAEQLATAQNDNASSEDDDDIHNLISQVSGLELLDEQGQPILFKDGVEGLAEREVYVKNTFYQKGQVEALNSFFEANSDVAEMYAYKSKHGSLDGYIKQTDYVSLVVDENTTPDVLKTILRDHYESLGNDAKTIDKLIKLSENDETLRVDALEALESLKQNKIEKDRQAILLQQQSQQKEQEAINNYYGAAVNPKGELVDLNIKDSLYDKIIKTGKIGNILIPKEGLKVNINDKPTRITRQDLFAYFYNDVETPNGYKTQAEIDEENRLKNTDQFLIQGIKNITGGDISSLEKTFQNVIRVKDAKKIITMVGAKHNTVKPAKNIEEQVAKGTATIIIK